MNLATIIDGHPDEAPALISRGRVTTYGALRSQVAALRGGLSELGVGRGDPVAVIVGNGRFFVVSYLALLGIGAVVVPLNPTSPAPEIERELATVSAVAVIIDATAAAAWHKIQRSAVPTVRAVIVTERTLDDSAAVLDDLLLCAPAALVEVEPNDLAVLIFTSGTAGSPRAAMLSHNNLLSNLEQGMVSQTLVNPDDVLYGVLPMFHIMGLNVVLGLTLYVGASVVLVQRFDPSSALDTIRERGVTVVPGAPPMWLAYSQFEDAPADAFAGVRLALTGAAKMPEEAMRRLRESSDLNSRRVTGSPRPRRSSPLRPEFPCASVR